MICALVARFVLGLAAACCAVAAQAQNYPNKPIRVIVSIAAGSVTDVIMRAAASGAAAAGSASR